jgi:hypothetical protein
MVSFLDPSPARSTLRRPRDTLMTDQHPGPGFGRPKEELNEQGQR